MTTIRPARSGDVEPLRALARTAYSHYIPRLGGEPMPMKADYADLVARRTTWIAEEEGDLVGCVVLVDRPDHLLVEILTVAPDAQGRGIGGQLLRFAEQQAADRRLPEIRLCTHEAMTENIAYYPRRGFVETTRESRRGLRRVWFAKPVPAAR